MLKDDRRGGHVLVPTTENPVFAIEDDDESASYDESLERSQGSQRPHRRLNFLDSISIVVGVIIGSGIFSSPGIALERCGSPGADLVAWGFSGLLVMLAAHCYLELAGMMPSAGGDFDYLTRSYGDRIGFSFAWFNFFVGKTAAQAIIATIFGRYFESVLLGTTSELTDSSGEESILSKSLAVGLVILITGLNCAGIKESAFVSIAMTATKIFLVLMVFVFSVIYASTGGSRADNLKYNLSPSSSFNGSTGLLQFGSSLIACLWCYDGFCDGNFLQEEMQNPVRDLPHVVRIGLVIVTVCYILINIGYFIVLDKDTIIDSKAIAVQFGENVSDMFATGQAVLPTILALGVSLSTVGALNGSIMTGSRAFFAVARAGKFPSQLALLNDRGAPWVALVCQGIWASVLLLIPGSNFSTLLDYFGPATWMFYALTSSAVIVLRYREPNIPRPFQVPWYPLPPIVVIVIAIMIFVSSVMNSPAFTLLAIGFIILSFPVYSAMLWYQKNYGDRGGRNSDEISDDTGDSNNSRNRKFADYADNPLQKQTITLHDDEQ